MWTPCAPRLLHPRPLLSLACHTRVLALLILPACRRQGINKATSMAPGNNASVAVNAGKTSGRGVVRWRNCYTSPDMEKETSTVYNTGFGLNNLFSLSLWVNFTNYHTNMETCIASASPSCLLSPITQNSKQVEIEAPSELKWTRKRTSSKWPDGVNTKRTGCLFCEFTLWST